MSASSVVWTVAGADPSGGAGGAVDLATFRSFGVQGCHVVTTVTAQNSNHFIAATPCHETLLSQQLQAVSEEFPAKAIKLGALGSQENVVLLGEFLKSYTGDVICDPVLLSSSGGCLLDENAIAVLQQNIFPYVSLLTPNIPEAEKLLGIKVESCAEVEAAAEKFLQQGIAAVLIKGGHGDGDDAQDYFASAEQRFWLSGARYAGEVRGTGCAYSAAIAAALALDYNMADALVLGKMFLSQAICQARPVAGRAKFLALEGGENFLGDMPSITASALNSPVAFPDCGNQSLGFYPIVDNVALLGELVEAGVSTIQLRIKDGTSEEIELAVANSVAITRAKSVRLFVNDYWQLAIKYGAYGVHLGQEDCHSADIEKIRAAGLRLGISTHCHEEVARAHGLRPSYLAFGPVYDTTSKVMKFNARGLQQLQYWRQVLDYPMVAIGGINLARLPEVLATGVESVAVISAVTKAESPVTVAREFMSHVY